MITRPREGNSLLPHSTQPLLYSFSDIIVCYLTFNDVLRAACAGERWIGKDVEESCFDLFQYSNSSVFYRGWEKSQKNSVSIIYKYGNKNYEPWGQPKHCNVVKFLEIISSILLHLLHFYAMDHAFITFFLWDPMRNIRTYRAYGRSR
jgi:hypothetical protein